MRKLGRKGILIILTVIMVLGSFPVNSHATGLDEAKKEKSSLEQKKKEIDAQIAALEKEKTNIINYIEQLDAQLNSLTKQMNELTLDIEEAEAQLAITKEDLEEAKTKEEKQYDAMKKRIRYIYENGEPTFLDILVESKSISEFLNQIEIRSKITEYDNNLYDEYIKTTKEVQEKEQELEAKVADLNIMYEELEIEQDGIERLVEAKNTELAKQEDQISDAQTLSSDYASQLEEKLAEIERLEEEERKRAEEELRRKQEEERKRKEEEQRRKAEEERRRKEEELKKKESESNKDSDNNSSKTESSSGSKDNSGSSTGTGTYAWPVPSSRRITSYFGPRKQPTPGASTYHRGIDIGATYGSDIVAIDSGVVTVVSSNWASGNYIVVNHGNGIQSQYLHCSSIVAKVGDTVSKGQVIAKIGSTGVSTGPHLHLDILENGTKVDPLKYLK
ncbi:MAG: peptidoglycan DD-metalloendopeptidase family protein [Clostridiales bacterium]|nr:peptidoglycan DD-metalloendopeptidase family protein [Clostridiales bacterium]